ncbi:MAG: D-aminoacyl-tRNA deacylase [Kiritimatiellia bacterium]
MKALIQRVKHARVEADDTVIAGIETGYVVFLGIRSGDTFDDCRRLAGKTVKLRIFPDSNNRMSASITQVDGSVLVVPQFTLYADTSRGNRPGFTDAADPETARELYELYVASLRQYLGAGRVATGRFGAMMDVEIVNHGPVTLELTTDSD